jgi:hypothetical protein
MRGGVCGHCTLILCCMACPTAAGAVGSGKLAAAHPTPASRSPSVSAPTAIVTSTFSARQAGREGQGQLVEGAPQCKLAIAHLCRLH